MVGFYCALPCHCIVGGERGILGLILRNRDIGVNWFFGGYLLGLLVAVGLFYCFIGLFVWRGLNRG